MMTEETPRTHKELWDAIDRNRRGIREVKADLDTKTARLEMSIETLSKELRAATRKIGGWAFLGATIGSALIRAIMENS